MIIVGTLNPVKLAAVRAAIDRRDDLRGLAVLGIGVHSGVREQPKSLAETIQGAINRARASASAAASGVCDPTVAIGIESGVFEVGLHEPVTNRWITIDVCACAIVRKQTDGTWGEPAIGLSPGWVVPPAIAAHIWQGADLDAACVAAGLTTDPRLGAGIGAIGVLSNGAVTRQRYTEAAIEVALVLRTS